MTPPLRVGDSHPGDGTDELVTVTEVAQLLRIPAATLRYWRHLGTGPRSFRIGRHVRYYRTDVEDWLHHQRDTDGKPA